MGGLSGVIGSILKIAAPVVSAAAPVLQAASVAQGALPGGILGLTPAGQVAAAIGAGSGLFGTNPQQPAAVSGGSIAKSVARGAAQAVALPQAAQAIAQQPAAAALPANLAAPLIQIANANGIHAPISGKNRLFTIVAAMNAAGLVDVREVMRGKPKLMSRALQQFKQTKDTLTKLKAKVPGPRKESLNQKITEAVKDSILHRAQATIHPRHNHD